jgi:predicted ester cyclase
MMRRTWSLIAFVVICGLVATGCTCDCCDLAVKNREVAEKAFEAIVAGDFDRLDEYVSADYVRHSQASPVPEMTSLEQFKQWLVEDRASFPDGHVEDMFMVAEGDRVAFHCRWIATQEGPMGPFPASGKQMDLQVAGVHRFEDGKVVETWVTWDNLSAFVQLGHMPPPGAEPPTEPVAEE